MKKPVVLVLLVVAVVVAGWRWQRGGEPDAQAASLFADRIWIDHIPRNDRDTFQAFVAVTEHATGGFQAASAWRGSHELFRYEANGGELRVIYPQTGERETVHAKARRCNEKEMDFCLDLEGATRGVKRYYSRKGWEIDGGRSAAAALQQVDALHAKLTAAAH
ncbi:MAG: hypothetical protein H7138_12500 [Myxococcales bacterium]|nr:hypothetical protein [Myxococcales bacterium]